MTMNDQAVRAAAELYAESLSGPKWYNLAERVKDRDGYACRQCGGTQNLEAHHLFYLPFKDGKPVPAWAYLTPALITLCRECHEKAVPISRTTIPAIPVHRMTARELACCICVISNLQPTKAAKWLDPSLYRNSVCQWLQRNTISTAGRDLCEAVIKSFRASEDRTKAKQPQVTPPSDAPKAVIEEQQRITPRTDALEDIDERLDHLELLTVRLQAVVADKKNQEDLAEDIRREELRRIFNAVWRVLKDEHAPGTHTAETVSFRPAGDRHGNLQA